MGIRLDWEVESEGGSEAVAEDAGALAAQRRRQVITQRALMVGVVMVIAGAVIFALRVRQVRAQMLEALTATIEAETLALRLGNKDRFMLLQGASADWRSEQRRNFDLFQNTNPKVTVTDEIVDLQMNGDEARVTVRILVGDIESTATWLYGYSTENGWRHIATEGEPWARQVIEANGYRIEYLITDQETAAQIDEIMRGWWFSAAALSGVDEPMPITIVLDDQKRRMVWEDQSETRLILPSRDEDGGETNLFDPGTYRALSMRLADRWVRYVLGDHVFAPGDIWVEAETQLWMRQIFDPQAIAPPVFSQLTGAFGVDIVPNLLRILRDHPQISVANAMDQAMTASAPGAVVRGRLDRYFTRMLQAEFMYEQAWGYSESMLFNGMFAENTRSDVPLLESQHRLYSGRLQTDSINVFDVEQFGDVMWALTRFTYYVEAWPEAETISQEMLIYVPFIERRGYWVHTWPTVSDWGDPITETGDGYKLTYYELDADRVPPAMLGNLWWLYNSVLNDFGVEERPYLEVTITPNPMGSKALPHSAEYDGPLVSIEVPSIHSYWGTSDEDYQFHYYKAGAAIVQTVFESETRWDNRPVMQNYVSRAIVEWEMDRHGIVYPAWTMPGAVPPNAYIAGTLEHIWVIETGFGGQAEYAENSAQYIGAKVLIDLLLERYGITVLPAMIDNLTTVYTADEWLFASVGIHAADIEAEWFERHRQALIANGFPNIVPSRE